MRARFEINSALILRYRQERRSGEGTVSIRKSTLRYKKRDEKYLNYLYTNISVPLKWDELNN